MLIYGASGHAKVILDCILSRGGDIIGVFDDDIEKKNLLGIKVVGSYDEKYFPDEEIVVGIGDNKIRKIVSERIQHRLGKVFHSSSIISSFSSIGEGTVVFHGAVIQSSSKVGISCIINTNASVDHDCVIGNFVHIAPNVTICGGVNVGSGTLIGAGSIIIPNINIGTDVIIGAGSVVVKHVPNGLRIFGNPAKEYGK
jgi:sugar O-acyltransferase (sialic acid O-acetyltransferase NeuD family)